MSGRLIAVAGAGGALGPAVVKALLDDGFQVAACDRDPAALERLPDGVTHRSSADLTTPEGAAGWAEAIRSEAEPAHGLLHLVGGWRGGANLEDASMDDIDLMQTLLFRTVVNTTRAFAGDIRAAGTGGRFALVSASQAQRPGPGNAAYAAMKAAAETWTLAFAKELEDAGATANVVVVNALLTDQMKADNPDKPYKTFTHVDDVARALAYLCSDAAAKMSGKRLELHPG